MTPTLIRAGIVTERVAWVRRMISLANTLPLESLDIFIKDPRNAGAAESYLRRGIEALLDIGRHVLAKAICHCGQRIQGNWDSTGRTENTIL